MQIRRLVVFLFLFLFVFGCSTERRAQTVTDTGPAVSDTGSPADAGPDASLFPEVMSFVPREDDVSLWKEQERVVEYTTDAEEALSMVGDYGQFIVDEGMVALVAQDYDSTTLLGYELYLELWEMHSTSGSVDVFDQLREDERWEDEEWEEVEGIDEEAFIKQNVVLSLLYGRKGVYVYRLLGVYRLEDRKVVPKQDVIDFALYLANGLP